MGASFHAKLLATKVFLEGQEVPCTSVQVRGGMKSPCTASIEIPYTDAAHKLAPRTLVHVFCMDSRYQSGLVATTAYARDGDTISVFRAAGAEQQGEQMRGENIQSTSASDDSDSAVIVDRNDLRNYKLMFVGEVVRYQYNKVGSLRRIVLICQDFTRYWQDAKLYWGRRNTSLHSYKQAIFAGATQLYRGRRRVDSSSDLINLLRARPSANKDIPGLLGGLVATLESVTGVFSPDATRRYRGVNDYMSYAELRLHLTRMIGASHKDDSSTTFINSRSFRRYLRRVSRQVKSTSSFYDLLNMLIEKCYQTWNSVPCPPLVGVGGDGPETIEFEYLQKIAGYNFRNDSEVNAMYKAAEQMYGQLTTDVQNAIETKRGGGPNDRLANERDAIRYRRDGESTVTDGSAHAKTQATIDSAWGGNPQLSACLGGDGGAGIDSVRNRLIDNAPGSGAARKATIQAASALSNLRSATDGLRRLNDQKDADEATRGAAHTMEEYTTIRKDLDRALDNFRRAAGVSYQRRKTRTQINSRLHCFLFHPDIYMMPPPKCNVIFPDQVQAIAFSRNWMSEVSRIWLHGRTSSGRNRRNCYFAPNTSILGATLQSGKSTHKASDIAAEAVRKGTGFLMPHEKFTGVVSAIVGLGDNDIFRKLHVSGLAEVKRNAREQAAEEQTPKELQRIVAEASADFMGSAENSPQPHMQRAANYMFFQNRYNSRNLSATLRYSPQLVAGMPCLILDPMKGQRSRFITGSYSTALDYDTTGAEPPGSFKYNPIEIDSDKLEQTATKRKAKPAGTHFVGILHSVEHVINAQGGAQTKITLSMCREHNEIANIFADEDGDGKPEAHLVKRTRRSTVVRPAAGSALSDSNKIVDGSFTAAVRGQFSEASGTNTDKFNLEASRIMGAQWRPGARYSVQVVRDDAGLPVKTDSSGNEIRQNYILDPVTGQEISSAPPGEGTPAAKVVVRRVWTDSTPKAVEFDFEDMARPPWMANVFSPNRIGPEYYQKMFGCHSIMDGEIPLIQEDANNTFDLVEGTDSQGDPYEYLKIPFSKHANKSALSKVESEEDEVVLIPKDLLTKGRSTQQVADQLAEVWIGLKEMGVDTTRFIELYTERAMANIPAIMGSNVNKGFFVDLGTQNLAGYRPEQLPQEEGFHCWAFGPYTNLEKGTKGAYKTGTEPLDGATERLTTSNPGSKQREMSTYVDTRKERHVLVTKYLQELKAQMGNRTGAGGISNMAQAKPEDV